MISLVQFLQSRSSSSHAMNRKSVIRRFKVPLDTYRESDLNMTQDTQQFSREEDMEEKSHLDLLDMTQPATVTSGGSDKENKSNSQLQSQQDAINRSAREFEEAKMQAKALKIKFDKYKQIREAKIKQLRELNANLKKMSLMNAVDKKKFIQAK